jgi:hypothetical protein
MPNLYVWDDYQAEDPNEKMRYWIAVWDFLLDELLADASTFTFSNAHVVIRQIIDEIVFNKFSNQTNRKSLKRRLDFVKANDPAAKSLISAELTFDSARIREYKSWLPSSFVPWLRAVAFKRDVPRCTLSLASIHLQTDSHE